MHTESVELAHHIGLIPEDEHARVMSFIKQKTRELKKATGDETFRIKSAINDEVLQVLSKYVPMAAPKTVVEYRDIIDSSITIHTETLERDNQQADQEISKLKQNLQELSEQLAQNNRIDPEINRLTQLVGELRNGHLHELNAYNRGIHQILNPGVPYVDHTNLEECHRANEAFLQQIHQLQQDNTALDEQIQILNRRIQDGQNLLNNNHQQITDLTTERDTLVARIATLMNQKDAALERIANLQNNERDLREQLARTEERAQNTHTQAIQEQAQIQTLQNSLQAITSQLETARGENENLTRQIAGLENTITQSQNTVKELEDRFNAARAHITELEQANTRLNTQRSDLINNIKRLNANNKSKTNFESAPPQPNSEPAPPQPNSEPAPPQPNSEPALQPGQYSIDDFNGLEAKYAQQIASLEAHIAQQLQDMENLQLNNDDLNRTIADQDNTIATLETALEQLHAELDKIKKFKPQPNNSNADLQAAFESRMQRLIENHKATEEEFKKQLKDKDSEIDRMRKTITALQDKLRSVEAEKKQLVTERDDLRNQLSTLQQQLLRERAEFDQKFNEQLNKNRTLRETIQQLNTKNDQMSSVVDKNTRHLTSVVEQNAELTQLLGVEQAKNQTLRAENLALQTKYTALAVKFQKILDDIRQIDTDFKRLIQCDNKSQQFGRICATQEHHNIVGNLARLTNERIGGGEVKLGGGVKFAGVILLAIIVCMLIVLVLYFTWMLLGKLSKPSNTLR